MPQPNSAAAQDRVNHGLPETIAEVLPFFDQQIAFIGCVVSRGVIAVVGFKRRHVSRVPAEILGPIALPQVVSRIYRASDRVVLLMSEQNGLDPVRGREDRKSTRLN